MALAQYSKRFWFPSGELAVNVPVRVFPENSNALAPLFTDGTGTTSLANPVSTDSLGVLTFWAEEGPYWLHADSESIEVVVGGAPAVITPANTVTGETSFGQAAAVGVSGAYARADHTHGTPPAPGGGGGTDPTASVRITSDDLSGLPGAASYAVVPTSGGEFLQCSIAAVVGGRIEIYGRFMRKGSHFLDWVVLATGGSIDYYLTTESGTPPVEGDPALYPSSAFQYDPGPPMFVVQADQLNAGLVTVGLAHQGPAAGNANVVYAHPTYPFRLRLKNIGQA